MHYVAVGTVLFFWGVLVGRAGRKVGVFLALAPVLVWFGALAWLGWSKNLDGPAGDTHLVYLLIGLLAFLCGATVTNRPGTARTPQQKERR